MNCAGQSIGRSRVGNPCSSVSEPLNLDLTLDSVEPEPSPRRSVCQRLPPKRLQYSTLGNSLISVVQTL